MNDKMGRALCAVAVFEACKGVLVLFAGAALFSFFHQHMSVMLKRNGKQPDDRKIGTASNGGERHAGS